MKIIYLACFPVFVFTSIFAQTTFVKRTGSAQGDFGTSCQPVSDNGIILSVSTYLNGMNIQTGLVKADEFGDVQWSKVFMVGQWTDPQNVMQAKDEGYIVFGTAADTAFLNNNRHFLFLHKTDLSGDPQWEKQFSLSDNDQAADLQGCKAGGYFALSTGDYNLGTYPKSIVTKLSDLGAIVWIKEFSLSLGMISKKIIEMENGNICFIANSGAFSQYGFNDVLVTMLDPAGNLLWSKAFGTFYDDEANDFATNVHNELFITGRLYIINREWDSFLLRLDSLGNIIKSTSYDAGTSNGEIMRCITAEEDGSCTLLGDVGTFDERDITMIKTDSTGSVQNVNRYGFSPLFTNYPYDLFKSTDGGFVFTGDFRPPTAQRDAIIAKAKPNGDINCYNSYMQITEYHDSLHIINATITVSNLNDNSRNDPSFDQVNLFTDHTFCSLNTGVNDPGFESEETHLFPNPTSGEINIINGLKNISVYSTEGKLCFQTKLFPSPTTIDLSFLESGIYIIACSDEKKVERIKLIKY